MAKRKFRRPNDAIWKLISAVGGVFLCGIAIGAVFANYVGVDWLENMGILLEQGSITGEVPSFGEIFWKYGKYAVCIWLGGWRPIGMVISGIAFVFRGISVGFCSAMMLLTYGIGGILRVSTVYLPQNMILIPSYVIMMCIAILYTGRLWNGTGRYRRKKENINHCVEYVLILLVSFVPIALGVGVERILCLR